MNKEYTIMDDKVIVSSDDGLKILNKTNNIEEILLLENKVEQLQNDVKVINADSEKLMVNNNKKIIMDDVFKPLVTFGIVYGIEYLVFPNFEVYLPRFNTYVNYQDLMAIIVSSLATIWIVSSLIKDKIAKKLKTKKIDYNLKKVNEISEELKKEKKLLIELKNKDQVYDLYYDYIDLLKKTK